VDAVGGDSVAELDAMRGRPRFGFGASGGTVDARFGFGTARGFVDAMQGRPRFGFGASGTLDAITAATADDAVIGGGGRREIPRLVDEVPPVYRYSLYYYMHVTARVNYLVQQWAAHLCSHICLHEFANMRLRYLYHVCLFTSGLHVKRSRLSVTSEELRSANHLDIAMRYAAKESNCSFARLARGPYIQVLFPFHKNLQL
jgi:hypothetical protein